MSGGSLREGRLDDRSAVDGGVGGRPRGSLLCKAHVAERERDGDGQKQMCYLVHDEPPNKFAAFERREGLGVMGPDGWSSGGEVTGVRLDRTSAASAVP